MNIPTLPAARRFLDEVRDLYAQGLEEVTLWSRIEDAMDPLLADPGLKASARNWPSTVESGPTVGNLLFYEDPDFGFVFNSTVRQPHVVSIVHDHGAVWTLYGLIEGHETMHRYKRTDGGPADHGPATLELLGSHAIGPGDIDVVPPGSIHQEHAGPEQSVAFIVRAKRPGTFEQHHYDPDTGDVKINHGPRLIPHELA
jgi:predicted metal-dependent enzyme (double-stranded beta helix superfamily)